LITYKYGNEDSGTLQRRDLFKVFNNYRINKNIIEILLQLDKIDTPNYQLLEAGCGGGDKLRFFTELNFKPENCYGIDINEEAIDQCKKLSHKNINVQLGSVLGMPYEKGQFDIVLCSGLFCCFQENEDIKKLSSELARVMSDDGLLFIIDVNENFNSVYSSNEAVMKKNFRYFNTVPNELQELLRHDFDLMIQIPVFGSDSYKTSNGEYLKAEHLHHVDTAIDEGKLSCAYNLSVYSIRK